MLLTMIMTSTRQVASRRKAARSGICGTGGRGTGRRRHPRYLAIIVIVEFMDEQPRQPPPRPHRPAPYADLTEFIDADGGTSPSSRAELAAVTAALLVQAGRDGRDGRDDVDDSEPFRPSDTDDAERFIALADRAGLDTLAALWRDSATVSLPGALWALYLLRQWYQSNGAEVELLWRAGAPLAPADCVVAGVSEPEDVAALQRAADAVLAGVYRGDLAVALERAAALFRVMACGRRETAGSLVDTDRAEAELDLARRNERVAGDLAAAAGLWRAGTLH